MSTPALNPLVEKIRGKYPGAYDDMDDAALTKAILAKYPQYSDLAAPPMAKPSVKMDTGEGPIAAGMTSFETQLSKVPAATGQFLKSAAQGFPEDTAAHNRVLAGQADPVDELKNALQKLNPIVSNSEGIDYGATAANLLPVLLGLKKGNISEAASTIKSGAESVLEHPVTKAVVKTADVASFERFSKAYEAYQTWKNLPAEIRAKTNPPTYPGAPLPEAPPAEVLQASSLGRGPQPVVDPAQGLGQIPSRYTPPTQTPAAEPVAVPSKIKPSVVEQQLEESLGGQKLVPGVPLRGQAAAQAAEAAKKLPAGFTPVESSAIKGYKYDPKTLEFESITQGGQHYIHGDVMPEQAAKFEAADSKGKAWGELRNAPGVTPVAKVINGKRISTIPVRRFDPEEEAPPSKPATTEDLSAILQESLRRARAASQ